MAGDKQKVEHSFPSQTIPLNMIKADQAFNVRQTSGTSKESIGELAQSIQQNGLMNPLLVRPTKNGYDLVSGFRRYAALKLLGREMADCKVAPEGMTDSEAAILNYVENAHRKDLSTFEKAKRISEFLHKYKLTSNALGARLDFDMAGSTVRKYDMVFTKLCDRVKKEWANPDSSIRGLMTLPYLEEIVKEEGEANQWNKLQQIRMQRFDALNIPTDTKPQKGRRKGVEGSGKATSGPKLRKLAVILAAQNACAEPKSGLSDNVLEDVTAVFKFVCGGNKLTIRGKTIFDPKRDMPKKAKKPSGKKGVKARPSADGATQATAQA